MCGDSAREELAKFALDKLGYVSAVLLLTRKERLQVARESLIKHPFVNPPGENCRIAFAVARPLPISSVAAGDEATMPALQQADFPGFKAGGLFGTERTGKHQ